MLNDDTKNKIQDIICGTHIHWQTNTCTTTRNFLCSSFSPSTTVKKDFDNRALIKKEQAATLIHYITKNLLWVERPPEAERLLSVGGEAEVYLNTDRHEPGQRVFMLVNRSITKKKIDHEQ